MHITGAITDYFDVAQIALYVFWLFFFSLIAYLQTESKREGYPLESDVTGKPVGDGWSPFPKPKTFLMGDGSKITVPSIDQPKERTLALTPSARFPGAPLNPTGNPLVDGVGPASYALRADVPDHLISGKPKIVPLRVATDYSVAKGDPDPRGMDVVGADGNVAGKVKDIWVDQAEAYFRYLEVDLSVVPGGRTVLLPIAFTSIRRSRNQVRVASLLAQQFADVPVTAHPEQVTLLEEDKIQGYYGGGHLYATPDRLGPLL